eukprot:6193532-Pleurochrysis_carterae.AAC.2
MYRERISQRLRCGHRLLGLDGAKGIRLHSRRKNISRGGKTAYVETYLKMEQETQKLYESRMLSPEQDVNTSFD